MLPAAERRAARRERETEERVRRERDRRASPADGERLLRWSAVELDPVAAAEARRGARALALAWTDVDRLELFLRDRGQEPTRGVVSTVAVSVGPGVTSRRHRPRSKGGHS